MTKEERIFQEIEWGLDEVVAKINPEALATLSYEEAPARRIEDLKYKLDTEIVGQIMGLANAVYFGKMKKGEISSFMEAIMRVGTTFVKNFVIFRTIFPPRDKVGDLEILGAKSFATAALAKIFATATCQRREARERAELGGLFSNIGRAVMVAYWHRTGLAPFNAAFVERNAPIFTERLIEKMGLPDYLKKIANADAISWNRDDLVTPVGLVAMAKAAVEKSFAAHNALIIESVMPDAEDDNSPASTVGSRLEEEFRAVGMGKYFRIIIPFPPVKPVAAS